MMTRVVLVLTIVALLFAIAWYAGFYLADQERKAFLTRHVISPDAKAVIDLSPTRYANLPDPVRRYFDYAFNGQTSVKAHWVEWQERGDFLLPVGQFTTRGQQASQARKPIYAWTGSFWRYGLPLLESRDAFHLDGHNMRAKLFGWITVMHTDYETPEEIDSLYSYLVLRYYGQAPVIPWALLPNDYVSWQAVNTTSARLVITHPGLRGNYLVTFAADGRIKQMAIEQFLLEGNHVMQREVGMKQNYQEVNGFRVPTQMDYRWYLEDGTLSSHYQFEIGDIQLHSDN